MAQVPHWKTNCCTNSANFFILFTILSFFMAHHEIMLHEKHLHETHENKKNGNYGFPAFQNTLEHSNRVISLGEWSIWNFVFFLKISTFRLFFHDYKIWIFLKNQDSVFSWKIMFFSKITSFKFWISSYMSLNGRIYMRSFLKPSLVTVLSGTSN